MHPDVKSAVHVESLTANTDVDGTLCLRYCGGLEGCSASLAVSPSPADLAVIQAVQQRGDAKFSCEPSQFELLTQGKHSPLPGTAAWPHECMPAFLRQ